MEINRPEKRSTGGNISPGDIKKSAGESVTNRVTGILDRYFVQALTASLIILLFLAWQHRWMADDAFISFRYAENFVQGNGLVWNDSEYVEGYTNFIWTMMMAGVIALGGNPAVWSQIIGIIFYGTSLLLAYFTGNLIFKSRNIGLLLTILLGLNHTFNAFATGGLETQMQASLLLAAAYICIKCMISSDWRPGRMITVSVLTAFALLTRPDSVIISAVILTTAVILLWRSGADKKKIFSRLIFLLGPTAVITAVWLVWKYNYYGNILPNTYYAKIASPTSFAHGLYYIYFFHTQYLLFLFPPVVLFRIKSLFERDNLPLMMLFLSTAVWFLYLVYIGGDHIEFRFIVPVLPFIFILTGWVIFVIVKKKYVRLILILIILAGTVRHALTYEESADPNTGIAPLRQFSEEFTREYGRWSRAGRALKDAFQGNKQVVIATSGVGAIPYYSKLPTVDMLGINDPWVARHGEVIGTTPGHQRISPLSYLTERKVNLLLGHPTIIKDRSQLTRIPSAPMDPANMLTEVSLILIPVSPEERLVAVYLKDNPVIDETIARNNWEVSLVRLK